MRHRIAVAAITAATIIIGACADQDGGATKLSTEPGGNADPRYTTTTSAAVLDPHTHQLRALGSNTISAPRVSASVAAGGSGSLLQIENGSPGLATSTGYSTTSFVDASMHTHRVVLLYGKYGGPPAAVQHYMDGTLVSTARYSWQHAGAVWVRTSSIVSEVSNNTVVGTYTTTTAIASSPGAPGKPGAPGTPGGPGIPVKLEHQPGSANALERMIGRVAYAAAFALAPQDALAQLSPAFGACSQEWYKFAAASIIVVGLTAVIGNAPTLTPLLASQYAAAMANLAAATDMLVRCIMEHQPVTLSSGSGSGAGNGSGPGGVPGYDDCLAGSYAAHCTTPFTL